MRKSFLYIKNKLTLLIAIALAVSVGGLTTSVVMATSGSDGKITTCVDNNDKSLSAASSTGCATNSTALSWYDGAIAYAHVVFDPTTNTYSLDAARSKNVSAIYSDPVNALGYVCLTVGQTPKSAVVTGGTGSGTFNTELKDANGWTSDPANGIPAECNSLNSSANVGILGTASSFFVQVY